MATSETVLAIYDGFETANEALQALFDEGFLRSDVGLIVSNPNGDYSNLDFRFKAVDELSNKENGFDTLLAQLVGTTSGLTSIIIPGIGSSVVAGPLAELVSGGTGSVVGGMTASLVHLGVPADEAGYYAEAVRRGYALITVHIRTDRAMAIAMDILLRNHPINLNNHTEQSGGLDSQSEVKPYFKTHESIGRYPAYPLAFS